MENPKSVGRFYLSTIALAIVFAVIVSVCVGNFSRLLWTFAVIGVLLIGCVVVSLFFTIVFGPLLWLLSQLCGRGGNQGPSGEERK